MFLIPLADGRNKAIKLYCCILRLCTYGHGFSFTDVWYY